MQKRPRVEMNYSIASGAARTKAIEIHMISNKGPAKQFGCNYDSKKFPRARMIDQNSFYRLLLHTDRQCVRRFTG